jgi:hypothetical protein
MVDMRGDRDFNLHNPADALNLVNDTACDLLKERPIEFVSIGRHCLGIR